jgi:uncharacterized protein (TIGR02996 family)
MQTEAEAFLQRIRAYPDDDTPRLIFADWLEEQEGRMAGAAERARFIRVQIALAKYDAEAAADPYRPNPARAEREATRARLQADDRALRVAHASEWEGPFRRLATAPVFRRGFVEEIKVGGREFLRHTNELFSAGPLRHLHLLDVGGSLTAALQCPYLSRLNALTIYASHIGAPVAQAVSQSPHLAGLKALDLRRNDLEDEAVELLANSAFLANLEELDLSENAIGETGARALATSRRSGRGRGTRGVGETLLTPRARSGFQRGWQCTALFCESSI